MFKKQGRSSGTMETLKGLLFPVKPYWFYFLIIALVSFEGSFCSIGMTEGLRSLVNADQQKNVPMVWASFILQ